MRAIPGGGGGGVGGSSRQIQPLEKGLRRSMSQAACLQGRSVIRAVGGVNHIAQGSF